MSAFDQASDEIANDELRAAAHKSRDDMKDSETVRRHVAQDSSDEGAIPQQRFAKLQGPRG